MKKIVAVILSLMLSLGLLQPQMALAEETDILKEIFEALTAEDSAYTVSKAQSVESFPETKYEETLDENGFTITVSGNEYLNGSWSFVRDGDDLTLTVDGNDYGGIGMVVYVIRAIGDYYGINPALLMAYINGLQALGMESPVFRTVDDEAAETTEYRVSLVGPYDLKELDQMILTEDIIRFYGNDEPLTDETVNRYMNLGKVFISVYGSRTNLTILAGEYGELDDVALQGIVNMVKVLQPEGWEAFAADFTELKETETENYSVALNVDEETASQIMDLPQEGYAYALLWFGEAEK